ncbi:superoxide dismutase family protein [Streptomyces sp. NPDC053367]|uniref:superoxide dismutase family protein n=1 Tax=Streptomyces sp. NPDC053367 TaxID=3365700 RepID=UPI0037D00D96
MVGAISAAAVAAVVLAAGPGGHADGYWMHTEARFAPPTAFVPSVAITYDMDLVPAAARIRVSQHTGPQGATTVRLRVEGMKPGHPYGAQVHREPCGADPAAAGGRYQHEPGLDAEHVSAENEVWLDFTPGAAGSAEVTARHDWGFRRGEASSVVIREDAGGKGDRVGCFTVPFGWVAGAA